MHKIISCLFNEQNDISVYCAICHMIIDLPAVSSLTPPFERHQISSRDYHHLMHTVKITFLFHNIYKQHLPMKKTNKNHPHFTPGKLRCNESKAWMTVVLQFKLEERKREMVPGDLNKLICKLQRFSSCFKTTSAISIARPSNGF